MTDLEAATKDRVLVADDEEAIRSLFSQVLSYGLPDCKVDLAENGADAVESFQENHHSVVLMDLCMPVMDGNEAFNQIRKVCDERNWEMPAVVFCTGYDPSQHVQNAIAGNPRHCLLRKPVTNDTLVEAIKIRLVDGYM